MSALIRSIAVAFFLSCISALAAAAIDTPAYTFRVTSENGAYEIHDKAADVTWRSRAGGFGEATLMVSEKPKRCSLTRPVVRSSAGAVTLEFKPLDNDEATIRVQARAMGDGRTLEFSYRADPRLNVESIRLLDDALWITDAANGYAVAPVREGLLAPSNSGLSFMQRFDTYAYEGCHMQMFGLVQNGAAALLTWDDPYVAVELRSSLTNLASADAKQILSTSLVLRKSATSFRIQILGRGDYVSIGKAYRAIAKERGLLVTWDEKLKENPARAKYIGASNYKLWSALDRRMNDDGTKEERVRVNWTFHEAAEIAEHLQRDLKLDRILFMMGGWIHRGYDNQHPDILPTAPECGGDAAFAEACRRIRALGYILSLHDNYQDIYRDSPSWNERWIQKSPDGALTKGGSWAGGRAYITCSKMALELAQRPQNLRAVKRLSNADSYFIDTTYAAGLQECFDKEHPLTRREDIRWKQALSDYARDVFGSLGSECGREWAIPHADFFEGLTGVSGNYYHNKDLVKNLGASVIPLFEIVYRDCIAMYGKYGYDPAQAAEYVLHHIAIGRPLHYHNIPARLYWKEPARGPDMLGMRPGIADLKQTGDRQFTVTYRWSVEKTVTNDWRVFVHFTDAAGNIKFQNDYIPETAVSQWSIGERTDGPFAVKAPAQLSGTFNVRMGLFEPQSLSRARLTGPDDGDRSYLVGKLTISGNRVEFEPAASIPKAIGDPALFTRADYGWAEGLHVLDRFVKNTHEILSPLNEITARVPMTEHEFLTPDRKVQRSVFGSGAERVEVIVNGSAGNLGHKSKLGGDVILPPFGFVIESPSFAAFCATAWNARKYPEPALFTMRSLDDKPLSKAKQIRVFHGFGDHLLKFADSLESIATERVLDRK